MRKTGCLHTCVVYAWLEKEHSRDLLIFFYTSRNLHVVRHVRKLQRNKHGWRHGYPSVTTPRRSCTERRWTTKQKQLAKAPYHSSWNRFFFNRKGLRPRAPFPQQADENVRTYSDDEFTVIRGILWAWCWIFVPLQWVLQCKYYSPASLYWNTSDVFYPLMWRLAFLSSHSLPEVGHACLFFHYDQHAALLEDVGAAAPSWKTSAEVRLSFSVAEFTWSWKRFYFLFFLT